MKRLLFLYSCFFALAINMNAEIKLEKLWEFSQGSSTLPAWMGANTERSMACYDGHLYIASRNLGNKLLTIDDNGLLSKSTTMTGLISGTLTGNNIGVTNDGQILVGSAGQQGFSIQKVDKETGVATSLLTSPSSNVLNGGRIDGWGVYGTMQKGYIAVPVSYVAGTTNGGNEILLFNIGNGIVTNEKYPVRISNINGTGATASMVNDSRFYVLSGLFAPKLISFDNAGQEWKIAEDQFGTVKPGAECAGGAEFSYQDKSYFVSAGGNQFGALQIFDISDGLANASEVFSTAPLGNVANTFSKTNPVCVDVRDDGAYIYVLSTNNGIAAYRLYDSSIFAGTYTVGTGGNYATLYDAMADIKTRKQEIKGNINLEIISDITETKNVAVALDISPYTITIRPDKNELRTITFTSSEVNPGPYGALVIGADISSTAGVATKNIIIDGAAKGTKERKLKLQTSATVYSRSHPVTIYGDVSNLTIKNCIIENKATVSGTANNYAICIRRISNTNTWPSGITIENNEIINTAGTSSDGIAPDLGNSGGTGVMTGLIIKDNIIKARARCIIVGYVDGMEITGNTFSIEQSSSGLVSAGLLGFGTVKGTINVSGNKFTDMSTANTATTGGIKAIVTEGTDAVWQIENNFFGGINKTSASGGSLFSFIECNTPTTIRHNTFFMNKTDNIPSQYDAIVVKPGANAITEIKNNIFASYETATANTFIKGMDSGISDYNSFWFEASNTSCSFDGTNKTFDAYKNASLNDSNSKFGKIDFVNPNSGDLHISKASIGNANLMVPLIADIPVDIDGDMRSETTYAGADEPLTPIISTPTALRASSVTENSFTANWSEIDGISNYKLSVYTKNPDSYIIENKTVGGTSYEVTGLNQATNYYYRVIAVDEPFQSQASNEILARTLTHHNPDEGYVIPGFVKSPYFDEQVMAYTYNPNIKVEINAPAVSEFDPQKPTAIVMYGLPNGNSTDWTIGKLPATGDDWHYQIQHIGAQTRFIRSQNPEYNLVTVYLEASSQSWGTWRSSTTNGDKIIMELTESILDLFTGLNPYIVLSGHSGGGNFPFGFMDAVTEIPAYVKKISFLDSNYNWDNSRYGAKLKQWLEASDENKLSVICYDDLNALLDGKPIVSETGGTWYRSQVMQKYLEDNMSLTWDKTDTEDMMTFSAGNNRIQFLMKKNPDRKVLHTVLVEKNGYIQALFSGTALEEKEYKFYGNAAYTPYIQSATVFPHVLKIPPRKLDAITGSAFIEKITNMNLADREAEIYNQLSQGNIPHSLRQPVTISETVKDALGNDCSVEIEVLPDFLAVGSDEDFVRIPMLPTTAQRIATLFGATLPTRKLSDMIHKNSEVKMTPKTMTPDASMTTVPVFNEHNKLIEEQRIPIGKPLTSLIAGHKKDIVITNRLSEVPEKLFIYGWHYTNGSPIQPLSGAHDVNYVDYSHGVRMVNKDIMVNGSLLKVKDILQDASKYTLLSDETGIMTKVEYTVGASTAPAAPKSFAVVPQSDSEIKIIITPVTGTTFKVSYGTSIDNLNMTADLNTSDPVIKNLTAGTMYFFSLKASNINGTSTESEKLGAIPTGNTTDCLVVNGFDRVFSGNKYAFIYEHGLALKENDKSFASATNDAVTANLINLNDYGFVDYILGEESTADKTFDAAEQEKIKSYLQSGGHLFVSSSEIGWDLGRPASGAESNAFMKDYLKCSYVADNPGSSPGLYKEAQVKPGSGFGDDNLSFSFADGTTTAVQYPDVIKPEGNATGFLQYKKDDVLYDFNIGYAGTGYAGKFADSDKTGKVILMAIPFETVYPAETRKELMKRILEYNYIFDSVTETELVPETTLGQNFPNPAISGTSINYSFESPVKFSLALYNSTGALIKIIDEGKANAGTYTSVVDVSGLPGGIYYYRLTTENKILTEKMIVNR